mgnify:CR=1 FL=1
MNYNHALFVCELAVVPKPRMTRADAWKKRPCVLRYWEFSDNLKAAAEAKGFVLGDEVHMEFHIAMPQSWSKKKKKEQTRGKGRTKKGQEEIEKDWRKSRRGSEMRRRARRPSLYTLPT